MNPFNPRPLSSLSYGTLELPSMYNTSLFYRSSRNAHRSMSWSTAGHHDQEPGPSPAYIIFLMILATCLLLFMISLWPLAPLCPESKSIVMEFGERRVIKIDAWDVSAVELRVKNPWLVEEGADSDLQIEAEAILVEDGDAPPLDDVVPLRRDIHFPLFKKEHKTEIVPKVATFSLRSDSHVRVEWSFREDAPVFLMIIRTRDAYLLWRAEGRILKNMVVFTGECGPEGSMEFTTTHVSRYYFIFSSNQPTANRQTETEVSPLPVPHPSIDENGGHAIVTVQSRTYRRPDNPIQRSILLSNNSKQVIFTFSKYLYPSAYLLFSIPPIHGKDGQDAVIITYQTRPSITILAEWWPVWVLLAMAAMMLCLVAAEGCMRCLWRGMLWIRRHFIAGPESRYEIIGERDTRVDFSDHHVRERLPVYQVSSPLPIYTPRQVQMDHISTSPPPSYSSIDVRHAICEQM
ncbi:uncharacterized protein SPPG_05505 [Spizellomyces punctatus DAOM BR117]|uniref:Transmembrane protein n=1 Tax=Spizellomyces punctatus (strain DAOM BR117) TaxID=645134 RepID=A0A0L0HE49_SPIPD|nr:uncharacterized protein SPPG_05505 [Spizellomyces punctatus DAOM BR117]KNC99249.1 hypothetical protein SPPG_05505 [Spizellomyces punctatus DAOM BR117]|eukprot:XP_016607289.1 hypothetical protein SPPG_05505 [Spizellomyces punctatus DAOM BR117]